MRVIRELARLVSEKDRRELERRRQKALKLGPKMRAKAVNVEVGWLVFMGFFGIVLGIGMGRLWWGG